MGLSLKELLTSPQQNHRENGREIWIPAKPISGPFLWRLRDAWAVLWGRAEAVFWP